MTEETFHDFQETNKQRCEQGFGHPVAFDEPSWPLQNWVLAICGEAGELANLVKKCLRGDFTVEDKRDEILAELADVMTYCDLAISSLGADTSETVWRKFREVSSRIGWAGPHRRYTTFSGTAFCRDCYQHWPCDGLGTGNSVD